MILNKIITLSIIFIMTSCAGPNPNPGERRVDMGWHYSNFDKAFQTAKPHAEKGEPWAELRLGIFYQNGWGIKADNDKAEYWYKKASMHKAEGGWANGKIIGAFGRSGYFNQNSDAIIAEYLLAQLYYENNKNVKKSYEYINNVIEKSKGFRIFFCCEFAGGRSFTQEQFTTLKDKIEKRLNKK